MDSLIPRKDVEALEQWRGRSERPTSARAGRAHSTPQEGERKVKIAIVTKFLVPSGNPSWVAGLARGLKALGHDATIVYIRDSRFLALFREDFLGLNIEFCLTGTMARTSEALGWPLSLAMLGGGYGKEGSPDILSWVLAPILGRWRKRFDLCIMYEHFTGLAGYVASILWGLPYVVFVHEATTGKPGSWTSKVQAFWRKMILRRASLVCPLDEIIASAARGSGLSRIAIVPSGCDPIESPVLPKDGFALVDGRWTPARNPFFLFEIAKRTPGVTYVMLGSFWTPQLESDFRAGVENEHLTNRIMLRTSLDARKSLDYYRKAFVYVRWAALGEGGWERGYPMGIRTALSNGCPIVFDRELGCESILGPDLPYVLVNHDPGEFALKINELKSDPRLVEAQARASLDVARKNTWRKSADILMNQVRMCMPDSSQQF